MASDRFMGVRPFYMAAADVDFSVDIGGGAQAKSWTVGSYSGIPMAMYEWERLLDTVDAFSVTMNSAGKLVCARAGGNFQITAMDARMSAILGFAGGNGIFAGGASTYTADYTPLYTWFPDKVRADRNRWGHVPTISATEMLTGAVSASATGDLKYAIEMSIDVEPRYHLYRSAGRTAAEKERCLDTFVWGYGSEVVTGVADGWPGDTGEPPLDGFYFWPDYTDIAKLQTMDAGNAESFDLTSSPETYAWCQFDGRWLERAAKYKDSLPVTRDYYGATINIHSVADVPTWVTLP